MKMLTRAELESLRASCGQEDAGAWKDPALRARVLAQAEYALDCALLLDEAVHFPAEPYGEAETLVARITNGVNEIWNRYRYRETAAPAPSRR